MKQHKIGDIVAITRYAKITQTGVDFSGGSFQDAVVVEDVNNGQEIRISGRDLVSSLQSADRYETEEKVGKTRIAEILSTSFNTPFTVEFEKSDGSLRTLRGRLISSEPLMGRCQVLDLDIHRTAKESGLRLVDNRTLISLIVDGVKYIKK